MELAIVMGAHRVKGCTSLQDTECTGCLEYPYPFVKWKLMAV